MTKVARVIEPALSLATGFATLPSNSRLTTTNGDHMENAFGESPQLYECTTPLCKSLQAIRWECRVERGGRVRFARPSTMPERLVKRGEKLGVEMEDFPDMIRFLAFVNVDVHCVAFPVSQELDVMP